MNLGCSVPLYEAPPHVENSVNWIAPKFWLQSTEFGMQTFLPVLIDVGRERVLVEGIRADRQVIHDARSNPVPAHRWRSPSNVVSWLSLNGAGVRWRRWDRLQSHCSSG